MKHGKRKDEVLKALDIPANVTKKELDWIYKNRKKSGRGIFKPIYKEYKKIFYDTIKDHTKIESVFEAFKDTSVFERYMLNAAQFSAAKSDAETKLLKAAVFNEDKVIKDFSTFKKDAQEITNITQKTWLRTEYEVCRRNAIMGEKWRGMMEDSDLYGYWQYSTTLDERVRDEHAELEGKVFKIGDPEGDNIFPENDWNCYDDKTEVYTKRGYILFADLLHDDLVYTVNPINKIPEWQKPITYIKKRHIGKMVSIESRNFNLSTTLDHSLLVQKGWDNEMKRDVLKLIPANGIAGSDRIYKSSKWVGDDSKTITIAGKIWDTETYCKFMGWYLSEGSVTKRSDNCYQISISQDKKKHYDVIKLDFENLPYKTYFTQNKIGLNNVELGIYLMQFGKSFEKFIPDEIKNLSPFYLNIFIDTYVLGDGNVSKGQLLANGYTSKDTVSIYSCSKLMIDGFSELILKIGKSSAISKRSTKGKSVIHHNGTYVCNHDIYRINISESQYFTVNKKHVSQIDYNGLVYCVEVPKYNTLLVSRMGKIYWCGNCRCTGEPIDEDHIDENKLTVSKGKDNIQHVAEQFRYNAGNQGAMPKDGSYFQGLDSANDLMGDDFEDE